jgi:hypothetical protein
LPISSTFTLLNLIISIIVVLLGIICIISYGLTKRRPHFLSVKDSASTAWGFVLWIVGWVSVFFAYSLLKQDHISSIFLLLILALGDLSFLSFAIAFCSGDKRLKKSRLGFFPAAFFILIFLLYVLSLFVNETLTMIMCVSAAAVLATISTLMMGWAFFVRWRFSALSYFIVSALYSILQVPAYMHTFFLQPKVAFVLNQVLKDHETFLLNSSIKNQLELLNQNLNFNGIFLYLFLGKIMLALCPFIFFLSTKPNNPDMTEESFWPYGFPDKKLEPSIDPKLRKYLTWFIRTFLTAVIYFLVRDYLKL